MKLWETAFTRSNPLPCYCDFQCMIEPNSNIQFPICSLEQLTKMRPFRIERAVIHYSPAYFFVRHQLGLAEGYGKLGRDAILIGFDIEKPILQIDLG